MKLKNNIDLSVLIQYGFEKIDKEEAEIDGDFTLTCFDYSYDMGHARRGQHYYILISEQHRVLNVWASKPDGDGCSISLSDVLIKMYQDELIEL